MFLVYSGDKDKRPTIIQTYKTRKGAEKAAKKRRKFWESVVIVEKKEA